MQVRILVGIVTYNSRAHIEACLRSLAAQTLQPESIRILDNASVDNTRDFVRNLTVPGLAPFELEGSGVNLGFGNAHNHILAHTDCTHYLLLNPDAILDPEFLQQAVNGLEKYGAAAVNGFVQYWHDGAPSANIYSCGHVMFRDRRIEDLGNGTLALAFPLEPRKLFGANGACALFSIAALRDVAYPEGPFDGAYFLYGEDDDLNWRMALAGYHTWFIPTAIVYHDAGSSCGFRSGLARRNALANRWLTLVKNEQAKLFWHDLPWIILFELIYWMMRTLRRPAFLLDLAGASVHFMKLLPYAIRRRRITPIRITFAQESALIEASMYERIKTLWQRYTGRTQQRSLWTKKES